MFPESTGHFGLISSEKRRKDDTPSNTVRQNSLANLLIAARWRRPPSPWERGDRERQPRALALSVALERVKALRAEGLGFDRIAARMNEERIPTRTGRPWHGVVVNRILTGKR